MKAHRLPVDDRGLAHEHPESHGAVDVRVYDASVRDQHQRWRLERARLGGLRLLCLLDASPRCVDPAERVEAFAVASIQCDARTDKDEGKRRWLWIVGRGDRT
jgi:hypothetical protein